MAEANSLPLNQSALYKVPTRGRLAEILFLSENQLKQLARGTQYDIIEIIDRNGKLRRLQVPWGQLRDTHDRIHYLFSQLKAGDYLHSGVQGRGPITNAKQHRNFSAGMRVDVRSFFPSCSRLRLARFFYHEMKMAGDVAHLLSRLCTHNESLPTGSPVSMPLAFWMHRRLFDRLDVIARQNGYRFTLFVDDMTFSSQVAIPAKFQLAVRSELRRVGLLDHPRKTSRVPAGVPRKITGIIVPGSADLRVSNAQRAKFLRGLEDLKDRPPGIEGQGKKLRGLLTWMRQVEPNIFPRAGVELLNLISQSPKARLNSKT